MDEAHIGLQSAFSAQSHPTISLTAHRLAKLANTLSFARDRSPFYSSLVPGGLIEASDAPVVLQGLPILDPSSWDKIRDRLRTGSAENVTIGFTHGTTGDPKTYYFSDSELQAFTREAQAEIDGHRLNLIGTNHGPVASIAQSSDITCLPLESRADFDLASRMIARDNVALDRPRIQIITGALAHVKALSLYMLDRYGSIDSFGVRLIEVHRHVLSPRWEQRLHSWWNADIVRHYGLAELSMCGALSCDYCGYFHLAPSCVGEVVDLSDPKQYVMPGERGALVVTAFYPYVEFEPRIRYRTGDVVELAGELCPGWGELGFRPLGREKYCLPIDGDGEIITPVECFEVIADLPQIAVRHEGHPLYGAAEFNDESGSPRFILQRHNGTTELHIELRFDPRVWKNEAADVEAMVRSKLDDRIEIVMHKPGDLNLHEFYFV